MARAFEHLLSPGRIGSLGLRNRIVMSPMGSNLARKDGSLGERIIRYYEERARGGVGLIIVGVGAVAYPAGACNPNQVAVSDDCFIPGLSELTRRVHAHGAKIAIQLQHAGKVATQDIAAGRPMWVPSVLPMKMGDLFDDLRPEEISAVTAYLAEPGAEIAFHEMDGRDISALTAMFADAARRARRAGFDGVELHAAHGYVLSAFLSPASNKREDRYGGSLENRARLLLEVIGAVRGSVGNGYPLWCRLDATEFRTPGGITLEDARRTAILAEAAGVDAVHLSAYADPTCGVAFTDAPLVHRPCGYLDLAAAVKKGLKVPVIAVGRIEPGEAEKAIASGKADFVAMARKLLADPELPLKLAANRPEDIRPCIYCYSCVGQIFLNQSCHCTVNPATGRETEFEIEPAQRPKRILIAGGGPAGLEAARVATLRGHSVTLCEKSRRLGGALRFSSLVCEENGRLLAYFETQLRKLGVDLRLGCEVTPSLANELGAELVLVAVGAGHRKPAIPGIDHKKVFDGSRLRSLLGTRGKVSLARGLSRYWMPLGKRVTVIGGGLVGIELADFLSERGRELCVLEHSDYLATEMALPRRWRVLHVLRERGVELLTGAEVKEITDEGLIYQSRTGECCSQRADSVVLASGLCENRGLAQALEREGYEVQLLGDCAGVGYIEGAIMDAARIARAI
ncbi:MAG: FAD-dependent oxidoreductase [Candidatus Binatia bacterium]